MAVFLQKYWSLAVLRVRLESSAEVPEVTTEVVINRDAGQEVVAGWTLPLEAFGFGDWEGWQDRRDADLRVPPEMVAGLVEWTQRRLVDDAILWVHLVKPYGMLGAVPWEDLQPELGLVVLRLPDVLPDQEPPAGTLDVAICASGPEVKGPSPVLDHVPAIVAALPAMERRTRVHVFTDEEHRLELAHRLGDLQGDLTVLVHDYEPAEQVSTERRGRRELSDPWLRWMHGAGRKSGFDVVHFVAHGYLLEDRGAMALARSPRAASTSYARHVPADELSAFLAKVGAYGLVFTSPASNYSVAGLRSYADEIGARRAGPVAFHDAVGAGPADLHDDVAYVYRLMLGAEPIPMELSPRLLLYVQPELVLAGEGREQASQDEGVDIVTVSSGIDTDLVGRSLGATRSVAQSLEERPAWLSVVDRYLSEVRADLGQALSPDAMRTTSGAGAAFAEGVADALRLIDEVAERHASGS